MRTGKILIFDSIFAILVILAMSSCEQTLDPQKVVQVTKQPSTTLAGLCKNF